MRSKVLRTNQRFIHLEQSMWLCDCSAGHALYRTAVTSADGVNTRNHVQKALGYYIDLTEIPDWVAAWIAADDLQPWSPMQIKS